jgi:glutamate synthase (NADPH/NADH) large chain
MCTSLLKVQQTFGYTQEDFKFILEPMATLGEEATGAMGNDSPLPVLSDRAKPLFSYFKQLFAQVTNPPIDPIREEIVMSLISLVSPNPNLLGVDETEPTPRLEVHQPILSPADMAKLKKIDDLTGGTFRPIVVDITTPAAEGSAGMSTSLYEVCKRVERAVGAGYNVVILSDRGVSQERAPIPALLACSAVHQYLVRVGLRTSCGMVVETGAARETHHFATLAGYGAEAIHPWLAFESIAAIAADLPKKPTVAEAQKNYIKAINKGLMKVMSKMGISTYQSYCGAQIFEAVGLVLGFRQSLLRRHADQGRGHRPQGSGRGSPAHPRRRLRQQPRAGRHARLRRRVRVPVRGEEHMWTPDAIAKLQHATRSGKYETYKEYAKLINDQGRRHMTLRGLFEMKPAGPAVSLDEVESAKEIVKRFATGAMSLGSISTEAHSTLAVAMNRIGGKSNTGEGGEDRKRFAPLKTDTTLADVIGKGRISRDIPLKAGDSLRSAIKQVASGRFGVTAEYLANADQIQIKMAQGPSPAKAGSCRATRFPSTSASCATRCRAYS